MSTSFPTIRAYNKDLLQDVESTTIELDSVAGASTYTVKSIVSFGVGDYILVGEFGQEDSEIVRLHASSAPTGTTITLSAACTFAHDRSTQIYRIDRNQVEFSRATTLAGSKSVLSTVDINAQSEFTVYQDVTNTTGFGFYRYSNSGDVTFTGYSESYPYAGYSDSSLKAIFDSALLSIGLVDEDGVPQFTRGVTRQAALQAARDCQSELAGKRKRWSYLTNFNYSIGEIETGEDTYALPTDVEQDGGSSILSVRIASEREMRRIDKIWLDSRRENVVKTTLGAAITSTSDITVTLTDSSDLEDTGSFDVPNDDFSVFDTILFTANNRSTNVVSGVTGITTTHVNGANVWQGASFDLPTRFTVFEGNLVLDQPPSASYNGRNLYIDAYVTPTLVDDLADEPEFPAYVIKPYIAYKLALILDGGSSERGEMAYRKYKDEVHTLMSKENNGQFTKMRPTRVPDTTSNMTSQTWLNNDIDND